MILLITVANQRGTIIGVTSIEPKKVLSRSMSTRHVIIVKYGDGRSTEVDLNETKVELLPG